MTVNRLDGCPQCFQAAPEGVWQSRRAFNLIAEVIDESHFRVLVLECPSCGQRSVSTFTEVIDWANGDDAQFWNLAPITTEESQALVAAGEQVSVAALTAMGVGRRVLVVSHPTGGERTISWRNDLDIGPHS